MANGGLNDILKVKIRVILKTELKDAYDQTLKNMDEIILLEGNDKGANGILNPEINKKKEVMSMPRDIEENFEERLFQSLPKSTSITTSKLAVEIEELAYKITQFEVQMKCKIAQLEVLVKENTNTMIKGFN